MPGNAPVLADEREQLLGFLAQQRDGIRYAAYGLSDEQISLAPSASTLSIGGLIKHVTATERSWIDRIPAGDEPEPEPQDGGSFEERMAGYLDTFRVGPGDTLVSLLDAYAETADHTAAVVRAVDVSRPVPVPKGVPWMPDDVDAWTVRWVLLHLIEETARHAGHADIIRETIDGAQMYPLMAAAEGWPATGWLKPWTPST